jgi:hypothetical protein
MVLYRPAELARATGKMPYHYLLLQQMRFLGPPGLSWRVTVQRGYMLRHGNSRLTASDVVGSLQLTCAKALLHKPR